MRSISKLEYDFALVALRNDFRCMNMLREISDATGTEWLDSNISRSFEKTFSDIIDLFGVPQEHYDSETEEGYCRDWIGELHTDHCDEANDLTQDQKAKNFLDELLSRLNIAVKIS